MQTCNSAPQLLPPRVKCRTKHSCLPRRIDILQMLSTRNIDWTLPCGAAEPRFSWDELMASSFGRGNRMSVMYIARASQHRAKRARIILHRTVHLANVYAAPASPPPTRCPDSITTHCRRKLPLGRGGCSQKIRKFSWTITTIWEGDSVCVSRGPDMFVVWVETMKATVREGKRRDGM